MDNSTYEMRLMKWTSIIKECRNSNTTIRAWCRENNINEKQLYYWQRKIRKNIVANIKDVETSNRTNFVKLPVPIDSSINSSSFKADMVIHVRNNVLELTNTISENLLSTFLKVLADVK